MRSVPGLMDAGLVALIGVLLGWLAVGCGKEGPDRLALLNKRLANYTQRVAEIRSKISTGEVQEGARTFWEDGGKILVEIGPPLKVAFRDEAWGDNWGGFVYDEPGEIMKVYSRVCADFGVGFDGWTVIQKDPSASDILTLFGGMLSYCEHLRGPWFWCAFN